MKKIITLLFIFYSITLSAQVAGYMGRRFSIGYTNLVSPSIGTIYNSTVGSQLRIKSLNASQIVDLNYVFHYRKAICFSVSYIGSKIDNTSVIGYNQSNYIFSEPENNARLSSLGFSLGIKLFKRSRFAPVGPYLRWDGLFLLNTIKYQKYAYSYNNYVTHSPETENYNSGQLKSKGFGLALGFGKQRVFFDKLLIDYGIRGAIVITKNDDYNKTHSDYEDELSYKTFGKIFLQQFINLRLGIGFLAF
ncbi:MAG: hypothetical protein A3F72_18505 [Bacteroidetes bacterium RIFCSPLOWO2_12_FULL_35_15]|nr:MAG: hypothetical protein A3F72_18505 [Bacteroidetes bacterium RIFCSPLOWO2_12_FULL_35_15]